MGHPGQVALNHGQMLLALPGPGGDLCQLPVGRLPAPLPLFSKHCLGKNTTGAVAQGISVYFPTACTTMPGI